MQQWDKGEWDEGGPMDPSSRRPSDASLPLHEAWMQHEAEWAQMNRVREMPRPSISYLVFCHEPIYTAQMMAFQCSFWHQVSPDPRLCTPCAG